MARAVPSSVNSLHITAPPFAADAAAAGLFPRIYRLQPAMSLGKLQNAMNSGQRVSAPPGSPRISAVLPKAATPKGRETWKSSSGKRGGSEAPAAGSPGPAMAEDNRRLSHAGSSRTAGKLLTPPTRARGHLGTGGRTRCSCSGAPRGSDPAGSQRLNSWGGWGGVGWGGQGINYSYYRSKPDVLWSVSAPFSFRMIWAVGRGAGARLVPMVASVAPLGSRAAGAIPSRGRKAPGAEGIQAPLAPCDMF